jgi:hypothetical protein
MRRFADDDLRSPILNPLRVGFTQLSSIFSVRASTVPGHFDGGVPPGLWPPQVMPSGDPMVPRAHSWRN